jgi:hypothetical protein
MTEMTWDDVIGTEVDYTESDIEEGKYTAVVVDAVPHTSKKTGNLSIKLEVLVEDLEETMTDYLSLQPKVRYGKQKNLNFAKALGMSSFKIPKLNADGKFAEFIGSKVGVYVTVKARDGISEPQISNYMDVDEVDD